MADSRRLSAQALAATEPDLALLLAVEGIRVDDSLAGRSALYSILARSSRLRGVARGDAMQEVETGANGMVVTGGVGGLATYDGTSLDKIRSDAVGPVSALALSPNGRLMAYAPDTDPAGCPSPTRSRCASSTPHRNTRSGSAVPSRDRTSGPARSPSVPTAPDW